MQFKKLIAGKVRACQMENNTDRREESVEDPMYNDARLFMWFVRKVNSREYTEERPKEEAAAVSKKKQKIRFKSFNTAVDSYMNDRQHEFSFEEDRNGFLCTHCDARYVYKRCLINHLIKSHQSESDLENKPYH
jgi:hypothetical protein